MVITNYVRRPEKISHLVSQDDKIARYLVYEKEEKINNADAHLHFQVFFSVCNYI